MWKDLFVIVAFWLMVLAPCMVAVNAGQWGTQEDGGYDRGTRRVKH